ncbi:MAG TPA: sugar-binding protein [Cytophagaceae bacterium]
MQNFSNPKFIIKVPFYFGSTILRLFFIRSLISVIMVLAVLSGNAQTVSGGWDAASTTGTTGYTNHGSGVIQFLSTEATGCAASAVHETSSTYDPTSGAVFNKCYQVFFGCPDNDDIGSDVKGDGMAFSFSKCAYNINNGNACGGGLGYMGACPQMITIEFDTWSSQGTAGFDATYGGGTSGNEDEIALHVNGDASDAGKITSVSAGNLEDGLEHTVCISYDPGTNVLSVSIDGKNVFVYDLTGTGYELENYFGAGGLNQTWSSGKNGATNPTTVSDGTGIIATIGNPLCPSGVAITTPSSGALFSGCSIGPIPLTATAIPPAGNTVDSVEFYVNGVKVGVDINPGNSYEYNYTWNNPPDGNYEIIARAYYSPSMTNVVSSGVTITVGGAIKLTSTAPTIDGTVEALWDSYISIPLTHSSGVTAPDLAAEYKIMYDADNLYLLVDVTDDDLQNDSDNDWEDDGVDVFIDIGNDKSGVYGINDYQYGFKYNDITAAEYKHAPASLVGVVFAQGAKAGGYIMEILIPWSTLGGVPTPGTYIGFDIKINDDDGGGTRDHELGWHDATFGAWNNPALFGTHEFLNCDPLPVGLVNFNATWVNHSVLISWATVHELNNDKFIIQRSNDLTEWANIGEVKGAGASANVTYYQFVDDTPSNDVNYYRLQQIDFDGTSSFSKVIRIENNSYKLTILPNPFAHDLHVKSDYKGNLEVSIHCSLGVLMFKDNYYCQNGEIIIQPELPTGTYFITLQGEGFVERRMVVKR